MHSTIHDSSLIDSCTHAQWIETETDSIDLATNEHSAYFRSNARTLRDIDKTLLTKTSKKLAIARGIQHTIKNIYFRIAQVD